MPPKKEENQDRKYEKRTHRLKCTRGFSVVRDNVYNFFLLLFLFFYSCSHHVRELVLDLVDGRLGRGLCCSLLNLLTHGSEGLRGCVGGCARSLVHAPPVVAAIEVGIEWWGYRDEIWRSLRKRKR